MPREMMDRLYHGYLQPAWRASRLDLMVAIRDE